MKALKTSNGRPQTVALTLALVFGIARLTAAQGAPIVQLSTTSVVAAATSPNGALVSIDATVSHPANLPVVAVWFGVSPNQEFNLSPPFAPNNASLSNALLPIGDHQITLYAEDENGEFASAIVTVRVVIGTPISGPGTVIPPPTWGTGVDQFAADPLTTPTVTVTLPALSNPGALWLNLRDDPINPAVPGGLQLGSPPYYYDLYSSAILSGPATVCMDLTGQSFAAPLTALQLLRSADGVSWSPVISQTLNGNQLCGETSSLGTSAGPDTFAIFHPAALGNAATTIAGSGFFRDQIDGPGGDPRDEVIDTDTDALGSVAGVYQHGIAFDAVHGLVYWTDYEKIRRADLNTNLMRTIGGDGGQPAFKVDPSDGTVGFALLDGVDATLSTISNPNQLAVDAGGNLYIADRCAVRRIDRATNIITTVVGDGFCRHRDGPALQASLDGTYGLAIDAAGNMWITEGYPFSRLRRVDASTGVVTTVAGDGTGHVIPGPAQQSGLPHVRHIAIDPRNGDIYLPGNYFGGTSGSGADPWLLRLSGGALSVVNSCALTTTCASQRFGGDGGPVSAAQFRYLTGVAVEANGDVLVTDHDDNRIRRISASTGIIQTVVGHSYSAGSAIFAENFGLSSSAERPGALTIDPRGGFFFANHRELIRHIGAGGTAVREADLSIEVTSPSLPVTVGTSFTYLVTVHNDGPDQASGGQWTMADTPGLTINTVFAPVGGSCLFAVGGGVSCPVGALASGADFTYLVDATPQAVMQLSATFTVTGNEDSATGNDSTQTQVSVAQAPTTTSSLTSSLNPSFFGDVVTFSATVTGFAPLTGNVAFYDNGVVFGQAGVNSGGVASLPYGALGVGVHNNISAAYLGDPNNQVSPATSPITQTVVAGVNNAPVNSVPGPQSTNEDTARVFSTGQGNRISVSDVDDADNAIVGDEPVQVTLWVTTGTLTLGGTSGLSFAFSDANGTGAGDGTADATMTFRGALATVNAALDGLVYLPPLHFSGVTTLTVSANDLGNVGLGGPLTDTDTITLTVAAVNDAPVNSVPGPQSTNEDTARVFSTGQGNRISVSDVDDADNAVAGDEPVQVTLSVTTGALTLGGTSGLSFAFTDANGTGAGDGTADATMTFRGPLAAVNAALDGLVYLPLPHVNGTTTLTLSTNDLGNVGPGGPLTDTDTISLTVTAVNDAPVNSVPGAQSVAGGGVLTFSPAQGNPISVSDVDDADNAVAGDEPVQVTLSVTTGALTLGGTSGLSFAFTDANGTGAGDGTADPTMTFRAALATANAALNGLVYHPGPGGSGVQTLTLTTRDLGNVGLGGPLIDTDTIGITVAATTFTFQGFFKPIDMSTPSLVVWNTVKAGQPVPVKWLLTMNGAPVSDPASFVGLSSYAVECSSGVGSIDDAIDQTATGGSGLQDNGGGNWQINWKTLSSYKNNCRAIVVKFSDGSSATANFKFK